MKENEIIKFIRQRDFEFKTSLGKGAFGETVLLKDNDINHEFVCKKYSPYKKAVEEKYYKNFVHEIRLLHLLYHENIVRIFNYYLYPENHTGYIMMEYIEGENIDNYLKKYPEKINSVFEQVISGFEYLEKNSILHRDIRSGNIMVNKNSLVKIIDFGFGKKIEFEGDEDKSITINWIGNAKPEEFNEQKYDHKTEIFFIGKLFESIISYVDGYFKYNDILDQMIDIKYDDRISSFEKIKKMIIKNNDTTDLFTEEEKNIYLAFAHIFSSFLVKRTQSTELITNTDDIIKRFENLTQKTLLEDFIDSKWVFSVLLKGNFSYRNVTHSAQVIRDFFKFFLNVSREKQNIILYHLENRLSDIKIEYEFDDDEEIPF